MLIEEVAGQDVADLADPPFSLPCLLRQPGRQMSSNLNMNQIEIFKYTPQHESHLNI